MGDTSLRGFRNPPPKLVHTTLNLVISSTKCSKLCKWCVGGKIASMKGTGLFNTPMFRPAGVFRTFFLRLA